MAPSSSSVRDLLKRTTSLNPLIYLALILSLSLALRIIAAAGRGYISFDEGRFLWYGSFLLEGKLPYRDFYCTMPLFPFAVASAIALFGSGLFQARLVSVLSGLLITAILFLIGKRISGNKTGILAALFYAISYDALYWDAIADRYALATLFLAASIYAFILAHQKKSDLFYALSGFLFALSMLTVSVSLILVVFILFPLSLILRKKEVRQNALRLVYVVGTFAIVALSALALLTYISSPRTIYLTYSVMTKYHQIFEGPTATLEFFNWVISFVNNEPVIIAGSIIFFSLTAYALLRQESVDFGSKILLLWFLSFLVEINVFGVFSRVSSLIPLLCLMSAIATSQVIDKLGTTPLKSGSLGIGLGLLTITILALGILTFSNATVYSFNTYTTSWKHDPIVDYIRKHTEPDEEVFTVAPLYVFFADRKLPLDLPYSFLFQYQYSLTNEERKAIHAPTAEELLAYLQRSEVKYVVVDYYFRDYMKCWERLPPEVVEYINENFYLEAEVSGAQFLRRRI